MTTSSVLHRIKTYSGWVVGDADTVRFNVRQLVSQPSFETEAEEEIEKAKAALERALEDVSAALQEFQNKPVSA